LSEKFPIENGLKQGDALSPLRFNFALEDGIRKIQKNQVGLKLKGTHQRLVYATDKNLLGDNIRAIKTETSINASKEGDLEVHAEKSKYMLLSRHQNEGQNNNINVTNRSFEKCGEVQIHIWERL
jgi:hypothetical protein